MHKNRPMTVERNDLHAEQMTNLISLLINELNWEVKGRAVLVYRFENAKYLAENHFLIFAGNPDQSREAFVSRDMQSV